MIFIFFIFDSNPSLRYWRIVHSCRIITGITDVSRFSFCFFSFKSFKQCFKNHMKFPFLFFSFHFFFFNRVSVFYYFTWYLTQRNINNSSNGGDRLDNWFVFISSSFFFFFHFSREISSCCCRLVKTFTLDILKGAFHEIDRRPKGDVLFFHGNFGPKFKFK